MKRSRLYCEHCHEGCGWATETVLDFRSRNTGNQRWNRDPFQLSDASDPDGWPVYFSCPECGYELVLGLPPWPKRYLVPTTGDGRITFNTAT